MRTSALVALVLLSLASTLFAAMPQTISYQGYLTTSTGAPAASPVSMVFSLYSSNPARNNPVWRETQPSVTITNGIFSAQLGSVTPIAAPFTVPYWLGIRVGADPEMTPLQPLASVGYALRAATVEITPCIPGDFLNCYTGPAGTMGVGVCKPGIRTCTPAGIFGDCVGEVVPSPEICGDVLDNNCNGAIDEGCPTCSDGIKNGNETDVDCGGSCPTKCAAGLMCITGGDCQGGVCSGNHLCAAPSCADMVKNGTETDVDCGGGICPSCTTNKSCIGNGDCQSGYCSSGTCQLKPQGASCSANYQCATGYCVDGYCTNTSCTTICMYSNNGTCSYAATGTDPHNNCGGRGCNGSGACNGCTIGGTAYASGAANPANQCQSCIPGVSTTSWSSVTNGTACNSGGTCTSGTCSQ